ncbi:MAG: hypothetical protein J7K40_02750 [candidate division Zixibacteria bacterium]|nr:hypothetical protein [candidate division Zixibacteria bacterium]
MRPEDIKKLQHLLADAYSLLSISHQILSGTIVEPRDLGYVRKNIRDAMAIINDVEKALDDLRIQEEQKVKVIDIGPEDLV